MVSGQVNIPIWDMCECVVSRVYNKREEYRTVKMCSESNVILHVWHGIRVT